MWSTHRSVPVTEPRPELTTVSLFLTLLKAAVTAPESNNAI